MTEYRKKPVVIEAMQAMAEGRGAANLEQGGYVAVSMMAYKMADAMMKAREA
jgi:hypothetical protein